MSQVIILSPAKLNLYLSVLSKRHDGYHNINSLVQKISLYDIIKIKIFKEEDIKRIIFLDYEIDKNNNTISKVISLFKIYTKLNFGYCIEVDKKIPIGAGLGGGSSNAATVLKFLNFYFSTGLSKEILVNMAKEVGADVPLFLSESTRVLIYGIGDKLKELDNYILPYKWFLLIKPDFSLSTKKVYEGLNLVLTKSNKNIMEDTLLEIGFNDLEKSAFIIYPELKILKECLKQYTEIALMTGSGSTVYGAFKNKRDLLNCYSEIQERFKKYKLIICRAL